VKALCEKYGLPYNTGRLSKQLGSVWGKIFRLAVPFGTRRSTDTPPAITVVDEKVAVAA
jgi:linoleoyl-CoA desaturase